MNILVASSNSKTSLEIIKQNGWGRMFVACATKPFEGEKWGFDNGAFACYKNKVKWDGNKFLKRLEKQYKYGKPIMAVCPDIVSGGLDSLDFSLEWIQKLPKDWDWYLAVQDNIKIYDVVKNGIFSNSLFKGIFLGGSTRYKFTAYSWSEIAHANKMKFHYARCSTKKRIQIARKIKTDSIDSAFPFWIKERRDGFIKNLREPLEGDLFTEYK